MAYSRVIKFGELVKKIAEDNAKISVHGLLDIHAPWHHFSNSRFDQLPEVITEKLKDTWWEVTWPENCRNLFNESAKYSYLADSITDVIRLRPGTELPYWEKAFEFANFIMDDFDETDDLRYALYPSRFDTISDDWDYLNYDLSGDECECF